MPPDRCPSLWQVLKSLQEMVSRHNLALPSMAAAPLPAAKPLAVQSFEVRAGGSGGIQHRCSGTAGMGLIQEPHPCLQVKVGKSQWAALTVDVESGTVAFTKRGSGSPEETIPQDKSKGVLPCRQLPTQAVGFPWDSLQTWLHPKPPIPHCLLAPVAEGRCPLTPGVQSCS